MSWSGIKKAINRAGNQVLVAAGRIEHTEDKQFDYEEKRYREMEVNSNKLQKEFKRYYDHLNTLTTTQVSISEALSSFYGRVDPKVNDEANGGTNGEIDNGNSPIDPITGDHEYGDKYDNFSQQYYEVMSQSLSKSIQGMQQPYFQTVLNPIAKFNSYYIEINEAIKKRNHKQLDYDTMKTKVKKLMENPEIGDEYDEKLAEKQNELLNIESIYNKLNDQLKSELPQFINYRIGFLDPSFEAFIKLQLQYFNTNFEILNNLQTKLDPKTRHDFISGKLDERVDNILDKMKHLNITS